MTALKEGILVMGIVNSLFALLYWIGYLKVSLLVPKKRNDSITELLDLCSTLPASTVVPDSVYRIYGHCDHASVHRAAWRDAAAELR